MKQKINNITLSLLVIHSIIWGLKTDCMRNHMRFHVYRHNPKKQPQKNFYHTTSNRETNKKSVKYQITQSNKNKLLEEAKKNLHWTCKQFKRALLFATTTKSNACSICKKDIPENEKASHAKCEHAFHKDCINTSVLEGDGCPLCSSQMELRQISPTKLSLLSCIIFTLYKILQATKKFANTDESNIQNMPIPQNQANFLAKNKNHKILFDACEKITRSYNDINEIRVYQNDFTCALYGEMRDMYCNENLGYAKDKNNLKHNCEFEIPEHILFRAVLQSWKRYCSLKGEKQSLQKFETYLKEKLCHGSSACPEGLIDRMLEMTISNNYSYQDEYF